MSVPRPAPLLTTEKQSDSDTHPRGGFELSISPYVVPRLFPRTGWGSLLQPGARPACPPGHPLPGSHRPRGALLLSAGLQADPVPPWAVAACPPAIPGRELTSSARGLRPELRPNPSDPAAWDSKADLAQHPITGEGGAPERIRR